MTTVIVEFTLTLPPVDGVLLAVKAFLRSSPHGAWNVVAERGNASELDLRRGNWRQDGGEMVPGDADRRKDGSVIPETRPITCRVTFATTTLRLSVSIHGLPLHEPVRIGFWTRDVEDEMEKLAEHLAATLGLDEVPAVRF